MVLMTQTTVYMCVCMHCWDKAVQQQYSIAVINKVGNSINYTVVYTLSGVIIMCHEYQGPFHVLLNTSMVLYPNVPWGVVSTLLGV